MPQDLYTTHCSLSKLLCYHINLCIGDLIKGFGGNL